jgi:mannose-6-phosphate isomerase-like protein (cupin superfamily)
VVENAGQRAASRQRVALARRPLAAMPSDEVLARWVDSSEMANAGDRFDMPDGSAYIVTRPSAETDGEYVEMEFVLPSGCVPPPVHVHPRQVEEYEVIEGSFEVVVDGTWRLLRHGESASVPQGALHTFRNRSGAVVRVRNWHRPAMRFEEFIERTSQILRTAGIKRKRDPRIYMCLSKVMLQFDDTLVPGRRRERIPMQTLARLGDLLRLPG